MELLNGKYDMLSGADAFNINETWVANSYLAIDQGPIVVMIENYRSSLLWEQFTSCAEVKTGMKKLGFSANDATT